jgi:streptogramin lyase
MVRRTVLAVGIGSTLLVGCSSTPAGQSSTSPPSQSTSPTESITTTTTTATKVQSVIDIGGGQALGLTADSESVWAVSYDAGTVVRIDPSTNAVTATIQVRNAASALREAADLWIAAYGGGPSDSAIYRIDPVTGDKTATINAGEICCDLSFGGGLLWVVDPSGSVRGIRPDDNTVATTLDVPIDRNAHSNAVFAGGAVWVSSDTSALHRIDPNTGAITDFDVGGGVPFLARDGVVWGASPTALWAVDEITGQVVRHLELERSIEVLSLGVGSKTVWVGIRHPGYVGAVLHIDLESGTVLEEFDEVDIPARIVLAFDSVWVTDSGGRQVFRIGPFTET